MLLQRNKDVTARTVAGSVLLIPLGGAADSVYTLNKSGACLWEVLEQPAHAIQLVASLQQAYGIDAVTARRDVENFISEMTNLGLLDRIDE